VADRGTARQLGKPGKSALCIEEEGQQGEVAKKQQETPQANKNVADFYVLAYLVPWRDSREGK
jgi:hypothetical protein